MDTQKQNTFSLGWLSQRLRTIDAFIVMAVLLFVAGIMLRVGFLDVERHTKSGDEFFYYLYPAMLSLDQNLTLPALVTYFRTDPYFQAYPNPLRAGYILLSQGMMKLLHRFDGVPLLLQTCLFSILSLFVGFAFCRRLFGRDIALVSLVLFIASPLNLAMARKILQESVMYVLVLLLVWLFYETLKRRSLLVRALFGLSAYVAIMCKETVVLIVPFFIIYTYVEKIRFNKELRVADVFVPVGAALVAVGVTYLALAGSMAHLIEVIRIILSAPAANPYVLKFQQGPFVRYLWDFFLISPLTFVCAAGFFIDHARQKKSFTQPQLFLVLFFVIFYSLLSCFNKNMRAVMPLDFCLRVFAAVFLCNVFFEKVRQRNIAILLTAGMMALFDLGMFCFMFLFMQMHDPVTWNLQAVWVIFFKILLK